MGRSWIDANNELHWCAPTPTGRICDRCDKTIEYDEFSGGRPYKERDGFYSDQYLEPNEFLICLDCLHKDRRWQLDEYNWDDPRRDWLRIGWTIKDFWEGLWKFLHQK